MFLKNEVIFTENHCHKTINIKVLKKAFKEHCLFLALE